MRFRIEGCQQALKAGPFQYGTGCPETEDVQGCHPGGQVKAGNLKDWPAEGKPLVERSKALGDICGVSYIYGIFWRFGLIDVLQKKI